MKNKLTIFFYLVLCSFVYTQELVITEDPVPENSAPIITNSSGQAFNDAPVNIQLEVSDQDGDDLTFTILTQPSNGSIIITQTQSGPVATYTPNAGFTGDDSFTYKANDGSEDSNTGNVNIGVYEKATNFMWATYYAVENTSGNYSDFDSEGNTYQVGRFKDYSNFKDGTSLNATYAQGAESDGFITKYNNTGELQWAVTFGAESTDSAEQVLVTDDGILVKAQISNVVTFSNGEQFGVENQSRQLYLKLNSDTGEIIWIREIDGWYANFQYALFLANGNILFHDSNGSINQMDPSNGDYSILNTISADWNRIYQWIYGENGHIYVIGRSTNDNSIGNIVKYDSNFNTLWNVAIDSPVTGYDSEINSIVYDSVNNQIYITGNAYLADLNPLGESYTPTHYNQEGYYFAAYNTQGILQFAHLYGVDSQSTAGRNKLEIMDNKLIIRGYFNGIIDFDVTSDQFYRAENFDAYNRYLSIYSLQNGLNLTGHYYTNFTLDYHINYKDEKLKVQTKRDWEYNMQLWDYDSSTLVTQTNVVSPNTDKFVDGVVELLIEDDNINFPPIAQNQEVTTSQNSSIEIILVATDEDNDSLTYIIVDDPINGSITISDNLVNSL